MSDMRQWKQQMADLFDENPVHYTDVDILSEGKRKARLRGHRDRDNSWGVDPEMQVYITADSSEAQEKRDWAAGRGNGPKDAEQELINMSRGYYVNIHRDFERYTQPDKHPKTTDGAKSVLPEGTHASIDLDAHSAQPAQDQPVHEPDSADQIRSNFEKMARKLDVQFVDDFDHYVNNTAKTSDGAKSVLPEHVLDNAGQPITESVKTFTDAGIPRDFAEKLVRKFRVKHDAELKPVEGKPRSADIEAGDMLINVLPSGEVIAFMAGYKSRSEYRFVRIRYTTDGELKVTDTDSVAEATSGMSKRGPMFMLRHQGIIGGKHRADKPTADDIEQRKTSGDTLAGSASDIFSYMNKTFLPRLKPKMEQMVDEIFSNLRKLPKDVDQYGHRLSSYSRNQREEALGAAGAIEDLMEKGFTRDTLNAFLKLQGVKDISSSYWGNAWQETRDALEKFSKTDPLARSKWAKTILDGAKHYRDMVRNMLRAPMVDRLKGTVSEQDHRASEKRITETTSAGAVATAAVPVGSTVRRMSEHTDIQIGDTVRTLRQGQIPGTVTGFTNKRGYTQVVFRHDSGKTYAASPHNLEVLESVTESTHPNSKIYDQCRKDYRKVPGKKRGEPGSCRKETPAERALRTNKTESTELDKSDSSWQSGTDDFELDDFDMLYEGGADTSWTNDGDTVTLQDILALTKDIKQINLPIDNKLKSKLLHWDGNPEEIERINQVTVSQQFPILVMVDEQGEIEWILDGNHRLHKAIHSGAETIPAKLIKPSNLNDKAKRVLGIEGQKVEEGVKDKLVAAMMAAGITAGGAGLLHSDQQAFKASAQLQQLQQQYHSAKAKGDREAMRDLEQLIKQKKDRISLGRGLGRDVSGTPNVPTDARHPVTEAIHELVNSGQPLTENLFRLGSAAYVQVFAEARRLRAKGQLPELDAISEQVLRSDAGRWGTYENQRVPLDIPMIAEAEYQGRDVDLNKPMRGGSKAYYVYVRNPDTDNVIKVEFGSSMPVKLDDKDARSEYNQRHGCSAGKHDDKTKPGYWSCRLPRYAEALGLSGSGEWW